MEIIVEIDSQDVILPENTQIQVKKGRFRI